jgi:hypothetical protein
MKESYREKMKKLTSTNRLGGSGRKSQGLFKSHMWDESLLSCCDENATLDYSTIRCDDEGEMASQPERERKVKFMLPEVTDVQISYRVPDEDKHLFYYTQRNISSFRRAYNHERLPTYTDPGVTEAFNGMFPHFPRKVHPSTLAKEQIRQPSSSELRLCKTENKLGDVFEIEYAACMGRMGFGKSLM